MDGINKKKLLFLTVIVLGTIVNALSVPLITKSEYIFGRIPIITIVYLGGILWSIIAIKISNAYIPNNDIEQNIISNKYLEESTFKNELTNLPNRMVLDKRFLQMVPKSGERNFKVLFIDVDGFKIVNDTLGYEVGDKILKDIASRLKETVDKDGELFHIRGDEFLLLVTEDKPMKDICDIANEIIKSMVNPFTFKEKEFRLTVSIGISAYPWGGYNVNLLLQSSRIAVQIAKESGKSNYKIYDHSMNLKMNKKLDLINNLHRAVENEEFILHYQPQVESLSGKIVGMEALIRWESPEMGMVSPLEFIPLAEETGLIIPIGDWVLKTACAQNKAWQNSGYTAVPISVNISVLQFQEPSFVDKVLTVLDETGLDPNGCI